MFANFVGDWLTLYPIFHISVTEFCAFVCLVDGPDSRSSVATRVVFLGWTNTNTASEIECWYHSSDNSRLCIVPYVFLSLVFVGWISFSNFRGQYWVIFLPTSMWDSPNI
jgi:hypothetical protein